MIVRRDCDGLAPVIVKALQTVKGKFQCSFQILISLLDYYTHFKSSGHNTGPLNIISCKMNDYSSNFEYTGLSIA